MDHVLIELLRAIIFVPCSILSVAFAVVAIDVWRDPHYEAKRQAALACRRFNRGGGAYPTSLEAIGRVVIFPAIKRDRKTGKEAWVLRANPSDRW